MAFEFDGVLIDPAKFYSYFNDVDLKQIYVDDVLVWTRIDAPVITRQPVNAPDVVQNQDYTFSLEASSGDGTNHYQWYYGNPGEEGNPIGGNSPSLTWSTADVGTHYYWCKVWNERGSVNSRGVSVNVAWDASLPVFTSQPQTVNLYQAGTATFSVAVNWNKNVGTLQWYKNGVPVGSNSTTYSFNAGNGDHGSEIKCVATNVIGSVTSALAHVYIEYLGEIVIDNSQNVNLPAACNRIEYQIVAGGGGGAGSHSYTNTDSGNGAGGGGAGQYKTGSLSIDSSKRNLYVVIGKGGNRGRGGQCSGNPSTTAEPGSYGTNTDIRVSSASGTVLTWAQGGQGGQVPEQSAYGMSGAGGGDGDGNAGGSPVGSGSGINGNTGAGRAGGSGGAKGGHGGQAGTNGGGWDTNPPAGNEMAGCGGGGGKSAASWGGNGGKGGATALKALSGHNWLFYKAGDATGYGNGGGGGCKTGNWTEMVNQNAGNGGNGSPGRCVIKMFTK